MRFLVVIPHFNHERTLRKVVESALKEHPDVAVFDDGSDCSPYPQLQGLSVHFIRFEKNRGKGAVLREASQWAWQNGYTHLITMDADGQHSAADIPSLIGKAKQYPQALIIGVRNMGRSVPFSSRFGRSFGGFWVHFQTGKKVRDIQSGLRVYPLEILQHISTWSRRYAFEVEIVVRALWGGFEVQEVPVEVCYPSDRVSHFHKLKDNLRLTVLNTYLTLRSMLPIPHRKYLSSTQKEVKKQSYWEQLKENLRTKDNIGKNAFSAAWGIFCGSIALPGIRQVMLFSGAGFWNLNRILVISFEKFCIGPIIPAVCIEFGYFLRHGSWLTQFNLTTLGKQFLSRFWEWIVGSFFVAPLLAGITFCLIWGIGWMLNRGMHNVN